MPAIPILVGAAVATGTAATVGTAVVAAVTTATVSTAVATAVGAGVIAGGATLVATGDAGEALKAAVITGGSVAVGGAVKGATSSALAGKASEEVTKVASSAAAGGATNTLSALAQGADVGQALGAGALGAAGAGVGEAASIGAQTALPKDVGRVTQGIVAGGAGGATEAAILGQDPLVGALMSAGLTAGEELYADAQSKQAAAEIKKIVDSSVTDPSVNIQVAGAMPVTAEQVQQLTRMSESKVAENILQRAANDPKFIRTAANEASLQVLRDAGYVNLANALAKVTVGMTTLLTPGNIGQETNEDAIMAEKMKEFVTPIASKDYALAPVEVTSTIPAGKLAPNESISRDGALLENGKPTGLYVDKAGTLYDEAGNPAIKNYAPANISPVLASNLPIAPKTPTATPKAPSPAIAARLPEKAPETTKVTTPTAAPQTPDPLLTKAKERETQLAKDIEAANLRKPANEIRVGATPAPMPEPAPEPAPAPRPVTKLEPAPQPPARTGLPRFITDVPRPEPTPSAISARDRQIMEASGIDFAPKPTEPDTRVRTDIVEEPTLKPTPEDDQVASQKFPLTEPSAADRRLIDYMYGNIGLPMGLRPGGMAPGTSALAQALSVGDPGALYLGKKGKERKPVWNVESLKLTDELGGTYG